MPRGLPDYYNPDTLVSQRLADINDLVASVLGISPLDNRGSHYWHDNFSEGLNSWSLQGLGDGSTPDARTGISLIPPASMYFDPGTASGSGQCSAAFNSQLQAAARMGVEFAFRLSSICPIVRGQFIWDNGTNLLTVGIRLVPSTAAIEIAIPAGWTQIGTFADPGATPQWLTVKIVADTALEEYIRALVGLTEIDLTGQAVHSAGSTVAGLLTTKLFADPEGDAGENTRIGYVIITLDEP